jgi:hypothetical protein
VPEDFEGSGATNVRLTVRTFRAYVDKLRLVARARDLRLGSRLSIGAALNYIIGKYDASEEQAIVDSKKRKRKS